VAYKSDLQPFLLQCPRNNFALEGSPFSVVPIGVLGVIRLRHSWVFLGLSHPGASPLFFFIFFVPRVCRRSLLLDPDRIPFSDPRPLGFISTVISGHLFFNVFFLLVSHGFLVLASGWVASYPSLSCSLVSHFTRDTALVSRSLRLEFRVSY